jgi:hypothetical protein
VEEGHMSFLYTLARIIKEETWEVYRLSLGYEGTFPVGEIHEEKEVRDYDTSPIHD